MELERNNTCDFTDVLLNVEKLVHVALGETFLLIVNLVAVHETFQEDELLAGFLFSNCLADHFDHKIGIKMNRGVIVLRRLGIAIFPLDTSVALL